MADLIIAAVLLLGGTSAAEGVRSFAKRRLASPIPTRRPAAAAESGLQLQR